MRNNIIAFLVIMSAGCSVNSIPIDNKDMKRANELCSSDIYARGVKSVTKGKSFLYVTCNDGYAYSIKQESYK